MFLKIVPKSDSQKKIAPKITMESKQSIVKPLMTKHPTLISKPQSQSIISKPQQTIIKAQAIITKPPVKKQLIEIKDVQIIRPASIPSQQLKIVPLNSQKVLIPTKTSQQPIKISNIVTVPSTTTNFVTSVKQARPQVTVVKLPHTKPTEVKKRSSGISLQIPRPEPAIPKEAGCLVCKAHTRNKTNFCSDECLRKYVIIALPKAVHSDEEIASKKAKKSLFEDLLLSADSKPKLDRVCVFEKSSGQLLTGSNAPTSANVRKWLQEHPTFEIVQTGTQQALEVEVSFKIINILFYLN